MDVQYFFLARTKFIKQFYENSSNSYFERKKKIENEEEPFVPVYCEDGEPQFLSEWIEADESLHVLAYSCISMLAASLKLYFKTFENILHVSTTSSTKSKFKESWFAGYKAYFLQLNIDFDKSKTNTKIIEEVILARNRIQHPDSIPSQYSRYSENDIQKIGHPLFVNDKEKKLFEDTSENEVGWLIPPTLHINKDSLYTAISEVEKFAIWLETEIDAKFYNR